MKYNYYVSNSGKKTALALLGGFVYSSLLRHNLLICVTFKSAYAYLQLMGKILKSFAFLILYFSLAYRPKNREEDFAFV